jgi:hypothetical protein
MALEPGDIDKIKGVFSDWLKIGDVTENVSRLLDEVNKVNSSFGEARLRATEFSTAVSDSVAGVIRVGGDVNEIGETLIKIAAGARRNVVATTESIVSLTAASKALGDFDIELLTEKFAQAGYDLSLIGQNLENAILYTQSLGLNARTVVGDVARNMEYMNRFNFQDGVGGLTKMAAQASMLRIDMGRTFEFADKVLNPQGAIEMASAFQRLGVTAGSLVDPFVLMDKAINDPKGLQDSLVQMTKQFTQFNEETNSFQINPGGVRLMKELAEAAGMQYSEFSRTALAAADLDRRLSAISFDIDASEEDKMLIANMAKMDRQGQYFVEIQDEKGTLEQKKLADLTQQEFERLREIQETRPKTIEDISRAQLGTLDMIERDIKALPLQLAYSLAGQEGLIRFTEMGRRLSDTVVGGAYSENVLPTGREFRKMFEGVGDTLYDLVYKFVTGDVGALKQAYDQLDVMKSSGKIMDEVADRMYNYFDSLQFKGGTRSGSEDMVQKGLDFISENAKKMLGDRQRTITENRNVNFGGQVTFRVEGQSGLNTQELTRYVNSPDFKQKMTKVIQEEMEKQNKPLFLRQN